VADRGIMQKAFLSVAYTTALITYAWVEQRGSAEVADNVRAALIAIDRNEEFIKMTLAVLMTPE